MKTFLILTFLCLVGFVYQIKMSNSDNYHDYKRNQLDKTVHTSSIFGVALGLAPKAISLGKSLFGGSKGSPNMSMEQLIAMKTGQPIPSSVKAPQTTVQAPTLPLNNINPNAGSKFMGIGTTWLQRNWQAVVGWGVGAIVVIGLVWAAVTGKFKKSNNKKRRS